MTVNIHYLNPLNQPEIKFLTSQNNEDDVKYLYLFLIEGLLNVFFFPARVYLDSLGQKGREESE